ncbi:hypothetical protein ACTXT7_016477 [Hymenolepis weldensis]
MLDSNGPKKCFVSDATLCRLPSRYANRFLQSWIFKKSIIAAKDHDPSGVTDLEIVSKYRITESEHTLLFCCQQVSFEPFDNSLRLIV